MTRIASSPTVLGFHPGPESCELCGAPGLQTELVRDPFIYGAGADAVELTAEFPVHTCSRCEVSYTGEVAEIAQHEVVCHHLGVLTPAEVRGLRKRHGLSRAAFARLTGFGEASVARWERGEVIQNTSSDRYLRLLKDGATMNRLRGLAMSTISTGPVSSIWGSSGALDSHEVQRYRESSAGWTPGLGIVA